jgi:hypothetical protein
MRRVYILVVLAVVSFLACHSSTGSSTVFMVLPYVLGQTGERSYSIADLPNGWAWDETKIQGILLPAVYDSAKATNDPNLWLIPCGQVVRGATTSEWLKEIKVVSVEGTTPTNIHLYLDQDASTKKSKTWRLDCWSVPGPWYVVVDAVQQPGKNGQSKVQRYTIAGAGYVPEDTVPFLN